jgi:hypothetical protein
MQGKDTLYERRLWLDTRSSSSNLGPICTCLVAHKRPKWIAFVGHLASALSRVGLLLASGFARITAVMAVDHLGSASAQVEQTQSSRRLQIHATSVATFGVHRALDTAGALTGAPPGVCRAGGDPDLSRSLRFQFGALRFSA